MAAYRRLFSAVGTTNTNYFNYSLPRNSILFSQPCATVKTRALEKKLGLPPKPKRPITPFIQFSVAERSRIIAENPALTPRDVLRKLAEGWKTCDAGRKEEFHKKYVRDLEDYTKQVIAYEQNLTEDQKQLVKDEKQRIMALTERNKMKSRLQELGRPKKPPTTFILYMLSRVHTKDKDTKLSDWLSGVAKDWNTAPIEVRNKYETESKKLMEQYKKELISWEEKMIKLGHIDVVRRQVLLDLKGKSHSN